MRVLTLSNPGKMLAIFLTGLLGLLTACGSDDRRTMHEKFATEVETLPPAVALMTSLPIIWSESYDLADHLGAEETEHWALAILQRGGPIALVDSLVTDEGDATLAPDDVLVLVQPYPLSPPENVALDDWVRSGGRVLLFADPMLTRESIFALGDRRRPQDVVLLSPILARWGLDLRFDPGQPGGQRSIDFDGQAMPVNLHGEFVARGGASACSIEFGGILADCRIGKGQLVAVADAAIWEESAPPDSQERRRVLSTLLDRLID